MPALDYLYDPGLENEANKIIDETHTVDITKDRSVFPHHHPFFKEEETFKVEGERSGEWVELQESVDFSFSPHYSGVSASTGVEAFTYLLIIKPVSRIRISYHAVGQYQDKELLNEINAKGTFDRSSLFEWAKFRGSMLNGLAIVRDPELREMAIEEIIVEQLQGIRDALGNPYSKNYMVNILPKLSSLEARVSNLPTLDQFDQVRDKPDAEVISAAGTNKQIYIVEAPKFVMVGLLHFYADNGIDNEVAHITVTGRGSKVKVDKFGMTGTRDLSLFTVVGQKVAGNIRLQANPSLAGTFQLKVLTQF